MLRFELIKTKKTKKKKHHINIPNHIQASPPKKKSHKIQSIINLKKIHKSSGLKPPKKIRKSPQKNIKSKAEKSSKINHQAISYSRLLKSNINHQNQKKSGIIRAILRKIQNIKYPQIISKNEEEQKKDKKT